MLNMLHLFDRASSMLLASTFLTLFTIIAGDERLQCTTCMKMNSTCYNITHIVELQAPFQDTVVIKKMSILRSRNTLYYSFESALDDYEIYKVGFVNLDNPSQMGIISSGKTMNFGAFDIDQNNEFIYLGGCDGIFVLETKENILAFFSSRGDEIQNIFYKGNVFFVINGDCKITRKKGDNFDVYLQTDRIKNFVITKSDVIIFLTVYGLFASKRNETVLLSQNAFFRGITIDLDDVVYTWWIDEIYKVNIERNLSESKLEKVAYLPNIGSMVFDNNNNILFTSGRHLYSLTSTNANIC
ncbi:ommochrome-binding protein-like [Battus philenor]|uniref:ommochrome-binding protein-like n=1 Tax=Battus philenor TaxID=42288 RepID=UPI0035CFE7C9